MAFKLPQLGMPIEPQPQLQPQLQQPQQSVAPIPPTGEESNLLTSILQGLGGFAVGLGGKGDMLLDMLEKSRQKEQQQAQAKALVQTFPSVFGNLNEDQKNLLLSSNIDPAKFADYAKLDKTLKQQELSRSSLSPYISGLQNKGLLSQESADLARQQLVGGSDPAEVQKYIADQIKIGREEKIKQEELGIKKGELAFKEKKLASELKVDEKKLKIEQDKFELARIKEAKNLGLSPAQESFDKSAGKELFSFQKSLPTIQSNTATLIDAANQLRKNPNVIGGALEKLERFPVIGKTAGAARGIFRTKGLSLQQAVERSVQSDMKETLGAQFAEKEGIELLKRTFDPSLPGAEVANRIESLANVMSAATKAKADMLQWLKENKTLSTYKGPTPEEAARIEINRSILGGTGTGGQSAQDQQALDWANKNPNDPRAIQIKQRLGQ